MNAELHGLCDHCFLALGPRPMRRAVCGKSCAFCCYGCCIAFQVRHGGGGEEWDAAWLLIRLGVGGFLSMNIMVFSILVYTGAFAGTDANMLFWIELLLWALATPAVAILGWPFLTETWSAGRQGRLTSAALIVVGVGAAYVYSAFAVIVQSPRVYFDTAAMVLMLFTLGRYLEAVGRARAARDLEPLLAAESASVTVVSEGKESRRPAREIAAGMLIRVRPGERIPVDGVVIEGVSNVDEAVITGESRQIAKGRGACVIAGSINLDGLLLIESGGAGAATRWAEICRSVRDALSRRGPTQRVAEHVAAAAIPLVMAISLLTVFYWAARGLPFDRALLNGLAVLVVACPCAVGLAAPLATSIGVGRLAQIGCLVRDAGALETLARIRSLAFDKTGTLTFGKAHLAGVETDGAEVDEALAYAAGLEHYCEHSLARAITAAAAALGLAPAPAGAIHVAPGRGVWGGADGRTAAAGNRLLMSELGWPLSHALGARARSAEAEGHSLVYVGWGGQVRAVLSLDDSPLPEGRSTIEALRKRGLNVALLTGDNAQASRRIAEALGIKDVEAELTPEAKLAALDRMRQTYGAVAMVGDGLNDGPVLADADVGVAVGSATDLARETASIVLPKDGLWLLPWVVDLARAVRKTTLANLMWAFGYNLAALALAAAGLLQPILAAGVMAGSSALVVANSLRLTRLPGPNAALSPPSNPATFDVARNVGDAAGHVNWH